MPSPRIVRLSSSAALRAALVLLFARLALHVFFVPVFEGPDEPFHLSRVTAVAHGSSSEALKPEPLSLAVQAAIARHPCAPDLQRAFGCPPFPGGKRQPGAPTGGVPVRNDYPNYENNQPPLYYAVAGELLAMSERLVPPRRDAAPEDELIRLRILSFLFLAAAIFGPLRRIAGHHSPVLTTLGIAAMFLPGFAESLIRCSNDGLLFLWAALVIDAVDSGYRGAALAVLPAFGCLIKLNALPILFFVLALLWVEKRRKTALLAAAIALAPAAILGGSTWGGAVKIAKRMPLPMPALEIAVGLSRSLYTIVKGVVWVGEWSFFRPPVWLLLLGLTVIVLLAANVRIVPRPRRLAAHAAALVVAAAGTVAFVLADRRVFGGWGGVGGWYVWGWTPWLALLADDTLRWHGRTRLAILGIGAYLLVINVSWFSMAGLVYDVGARAPVGDRLAGTFRCTVPIVPPDLRSPDRVPPVRRPGDDASRRG